MSDAGCCSDDVGCYSLQAVDMNVTGDAGCYIFYSNDVGCYSVQAVDEDDAGCYSDGAVCYTVTVQGVTVTV